MGRRSLSPAWVLLPVVLARGALLRNGGSASAKGKVLRLLADVGESVRKAGEDSELIFSTVHTRDQQLQTSLDGEIASLNTTLGAFDRMQKKYAGDLNASRARLRKLGESAAGWERTAGKYEASVGEAATKFRGLRGNLEALIARLQRAKVSPQGRLLLPGTPYRSRDSQERKVFGSIQRLLAANPELQSQFHDVFGAFAPNGLIQVGAQKLHRPTGLGSVSMTSSLLGRTVTALRMVQGRVHGLQAEAVSEFESEYMKFEGKATIAKASADKEEAAQAQNEQNVEELAFSRTFTDGVLSIDRRFRAKIGAHIKANAELVTSLRELRDSQLKATKDLINLLNGKAGQPDSSETFKLPVGLALLQTSLVKPSDIKVRIDDALRNKVDTHGILMQIKEMLEQSRPIDAGSVQSAVLEFQRLLSTVDGEQSQAEGMKARCESQEFHADEEEEVSKANIALMANAHNHSDASIKAASHNMRLVAAKINALGKASRDFDRFTAQTMKDLGGQNRDRNTIMAAVRKAGEVARVELPAGTSVDFVLQALLRQLKTQEAKEHAYMKQQQTFKAAFSQYTQEYTRLLVERRNHYESTLSALELYNSELGGDLSGVRQALGTSKGLRNESRSLCDGLLKFYEARAKRRSALSSALKAALPTVPEMLTASIGSTDDAGIPDDEDQDDDTVDEGMEQEVLALPPGR